MAATIDDSDRHGCASQAPRLPHRHSTTRFARSRRRARRRIDRQGTTAGRRAPARHRHARAQHERHAGAGAGNDARGQHPFHLAREPRDGSRRVGGRARVVAVPAVADAAVPRRPRRVHRAAVLGRHRGFSGPRVAARRGASGPHPRARRSDPAVSRRRTERHAPRTFLAARRGARPARRAAHGPRAAVRRVRREPAAVHVPGVSDGGQRSVAARGGAAEAQAAAVTRHARGLAVSRLDARVAVRASERLRRRRRPASGVHGAAPELLRTPTSIVDAGFGKRIVFGSDFPNQVLPGIDAIATAEFLSAEQKADILCNNAARFLRLDAAVCAP